MNERQFWIGFLLLASVALAVPPDTGPGVTLTSVMTSAAPAALAVASTQEPAKPSVDINITTSDRGGEWYKNPIIIGAGVIILVLLVALASRGGGTTVVKS
jgi:hypothetical protein